MLDRSIILSMSSSQNKLPLHKEPVQKDDGKGAKKQGKHRRQQSEQASSAESRSPREELLSGKESAGDDDGDSQSEISAEGESPLSGAESGDEQLKSAGQKSFGMLQAKWDEMFARLVAFREKHGHCLVPNRYAEDPQLGSWVSTQRRQYKILTSGSSESTPMTPERANKLNSIGFVWATKDPRHVPWETRYEELCQFVEKFGHAQVPIGWEENVQLSNWVSTQRQEYKLLQKGRSSRLDGDRIKLLNDLGFVWEAQRGGPRRGQKATVSVPDEPRARVGGFSDPGSQHSLGSSGRSEVKSSQSIVASMPRQTQNPAIASAVARSRAQDLQNAAVAQYLEASRAAASQPQFMQYASPGYPSQAMLGGFVGQGGMMFPNQSTLADLSMLQRQQAAGMAWPLLYGSQHQLVAVPNITGSAGSLGVANPFMGNLNQMGASPVPPRVAIAASAQDAADDASQRTVETPRCASASQKRARNPSSPSSLEVVKAKKARGTPTESASERAQKFVKSLSAKGRDKVQGLVQKKIPEAAIVNTRRGDAAEAEEKEIKSKDEGIFADADEDQGSWTDDEDEP